MGAGAPFGAATSACCPARYVCGSANLFSPTRDTGACNQSCNQLQRVPDPLAARVEKGGERLRELARAPSSPHWAQRRDARGKGAWSGKGWGGRGAERACLRPAQDGLGTAPRHDDLAPMPPPVLAKRARRRPSIQSPRLLASPARPPGILLPIDATAAAAASAAAASLMLPAPVGKVTTPTPYTPHPTPYTLHPAPYTVSYQSIPIFCDWLTGQ